MPEPDAASPSRRRGSTNQRQRHRRLVRKRIITTVIVTIVVVVVALWFSDTIRIPTERPSFAGGVETTGSEAPSEAPGTPAAPTRRALTPEDPLRLWIGGDSLAGALGPALGEMTAATGVVQPEYDSRQGSGLMSGDVEWLQHGQEAMDEVDPEVVVFVIGTNDAVVYADRDEAEYEQLTEGMMKILAGEGREVYWVNAPVIRDEDTEENVQKIDAIQRRVAERVEGVTIVDAHTLFADEAGEYTSTLLDETGEEVTMRAGDGIHLSADGAKHLARAVFTLIDPLWRITEQQVPGQAKRVIVSEGSDRNTGSGSRSSSSDWDGSSSDSSWESDDDDWSDDSSSSGTTPTTVTPTTAAPPPPSSSPTTTPTTAATTPPASTG